MSTVHIVDAATGATGQTTVATAGTAVQLTTDARGLSIGARIRALSANTGKIYVGFSNAVVATNGYELAAGESVLIEVRRADALYLNASASGDKVCFTLI